MIRRRSREVLDSTETEARLMRLCTTSSGGVNGEAMRYVKAGSNQGLLQLAKEDSAGE
jgi:hypothetical protein